MSFTPFQPSWSIQSVLAAIYIYIYAPYARTNYENWVGFRWNVFWNENGFARTWQAHYDSTPAIAVHFLHNNKALYGKGDFIDFLISLNSVKFSTDRCRTLETNWIYAHQVMVMRILLAMLLLSFSEPEMVKIAADDSQVTDFTLPLSNSRIHVCQPRIRWTAIYKEATRIPNSL